MHIAERLYLAGYITYPRTESTAYPKTFDFEEIIESLTRDPDYGKHAKGLLESKFSKIMPDNFFYCLFLESLIAFFMFFFFIF